MPIRRYLPSAKLVSIVLSLALSVGLVYAADNITHPASPAASVGVDPTSAPNTNSDWETALYAVQAQNASSSVATPDPNFVDNLLQAAQSPNLTETVGKTILINLTNAKSQGLGDDIPTQTQILDTATAQLKKTATTTIYTLADLTIIPNSNAALHTFGNAEVAVFALHPEANLDNTFLAIGNALDKNDPSSLKQLPTIKAAYAGIAADMLAMPVPQTLAPLHLLVLNDLMSIAADYDDMAATLADPLRGAVGFKSYQTSLTEIGRVFTNIAQEFSKNGILFTKDEPGSAWSGFLAPTGSPQ